MCCIKEEKDEEFSREAFHKFLHSLGQTDIHWQPCDPPDYYLDIGKKTFAVEVTQVMTSIQIGGQDRPSVGIFHELRQFGDRIEKDLKSDNQIHGQYILNLHPIDDLNAEYDAIIEQAINYLQKTENAETYREEKIFEKASRFITLYKVGLADNCLYTVMALSDRGSSEHQIRQNVKSMLTDAISRKSDDASKRTKDTILLLLDRYHSAPISIWREISSEIDVSKFHTIGLVSDNLRCHILSSENQNWVEPKPT